MNQKHKQFLLPVLWILAVVLILVWFRTAVTQLRDGQLREGRQQLEDAIRKAAVACYAAEGIYPPNLEYLCTHYGVQILEEQYAVFYEIFAENLMPEITVLVKNDE